MTSLVEIRERKKKEYAEKRKLKEQQKQERERKKAEKAQQKHIEFKASLEKWLSDTFEKRRAELQYKVDNIETAHEKYKWTLRYRIAKIKSEKLKRYWQKVLDESTIENYRESLLEQLEERLF